MKTSGGVLTTPDGRYIVVRGLLWRTSNLLLPEDERKRLVSELMSARRSVKDAAGDPERLRSARDAVNDAKVALAERGTVWWSDGAPALNRHLAKTTPDAEWYLGQTNECT